jgi:hypothetical protein
MSRSVLSRGRALASLTTVLGLGLGAAAVTSSPAQSAPPTGDCAVAYPVVDLIRDQPVTGRTVAQGTAPEPFSGKVLGVVQDGIAPDVDMVMVRLTSTEIDRVGGIWEGMSGSPVYAEDGGLIGAVAYGLAAGPSPVAGITPFAAMDDYLAAGTPASTVRVGDRAARAIAAETSVSTAAAAEGFRQLGMPLGVSGVSGGRLAWAERATLRARHSWLPASTYKIGAAAAEDEGPGADTIEAGGNLAASLSYGDVTAAGVGTATSRCGDRVVGFGHPMTFTGSGSTLSMHPADAVYVQENSLGAPFKVANLGAPVGTITDDHTTGITGVFGAPAESVTVTSNVAYAGRARQGTTRVSVRDFVPSTAFYENLLNHDAVIDGYTKGSELQSWTITGTSKLGPFELASQERYASQSDITSMSVWDVADLSYLLGQVPGVRISDVHVDSAVTADSSTYELTRLEQRIRGRWSTVGKGSPVLARAGRAVRMRATVTDGTGTRKVPFQIAIPARTRGSVGRMVVSGGANGDMFGDDESSESFFGEAPTIGSIQRMLRTRTRNDQVSVGLALETRRSYKVVRAASAPQDKVVSGTRQVRVLVLR